MLETSDENGGHLDGARHLCVGEDRVRLIEVEDDGTVPLVKCNVDGLLLDSLQSMFFIVQDFQEMVTLNEGDMLKLGKSTTEWMKHSRLCIRNQKLAC